MKVLVTGANGMLGIDLCAALLAAGHQVVRTDVGARPGATVPPWEEMNITDLNSVTSVILHHQPDAVVHSAAYTDVDGCTRDPDLAYRINGLGTWNVAAVCGQHNITMAYISTDFVFDGTKQEPYTEFDAVNPLSPYGASKLAGEKVTAQLCRKHFIVRTSWLFGVHGKSFPATMINLAKTKTELSIVCDQTGSPTHTVDLANTVTTLLSSPLYGTYHVTNSGHCTWYELAKRTLELAGVTTTEVKPIPASAWPSPTIRPAYSVLRHYSLELQGRDNLPPWERALEHFISLRASL
jgi:dTDP-4-dehydrorhamnose reductase